MEENLASLDQAGMETLTKTPLLLQHTTAGTPHSFAATSTLTVPVTFASFEARGALSPTGTIGRLVEDAVRTREGLH